jgi:hypothetical protein
VADPQREIAEDRSDRREEARRWVRRKRIFYTIVGIYLSLSLMWFAIDLLDHRAATGSTGRCSAPVSACS